MKRNVIAVAAVFLIGSTCLLLHTQEKKAFPKELTGDQLYQQGLELFKQGKYQEAVTTFLEASQRKTNFADAYYQMGLCYIKLLDAEKARQNLITAKILYKDEGMKRQTASLMEKIPEEIAQGKKEKEEKEFLKEEERRKEQEERRKQEATKAAEALRKRREAAERAVAETKQSSPNRTPPVQRKAVVFSQLADVQPITSVTFAPGGELALAGRADNVVRLLNGATEKEIRPIMRSDWIATVVFSPNGKTLLSSARDGSIQSWDVTTEKVIRTLTGHSAPVNCVAFSPDGKWVLSGSLDGSFKLWDIDTGVEVRSFAAAGGPAAFVLFSPDGKLMLSKVSSAPPKVWDVATGKDGYLFAESDYDDQYIAQVAFSPDGKRVLSRSYGGVLKLWDVESGKKIQVFGVKGGTTCAVFSPDGRMILSGGVDGGLRVWDTTTGVEIRTFFLGYSRVAICVVFSPDGKTALSGDTVKTLNLWDVGTGRKIRSFTGHSGMITSVAFSPDGKWILSGSLDKTVKLWDAASSREILSFTNLLSNIGQQMAEERKEVVANPSIPKEITLPGNKEEAPLLQEEPEAVVQMGHLEPIISIAFSPDAKMMLSGSQDKTLKLWDVGTGKEIRTFAGHAGPVIAVAFSPEGKTVCSAGTDRLIKIWDLDTGKEIRSIKGRQQDLPIAFSPNAQSVLSLLSTGGGRLWNIATGKEEWTDRVTRFIQASFSTDGKWAALGTADNAVFLIDGAGGTKAKVFEYSRFSSHPEEIISSIAVSPDGRFIVTGMGRRYQSSGTNHSALVVSDGLTPKSFLLEGHSGRVTSTVFSPDGKMVLSGSEDKTLRLWDILMGKEIRAFTGHAKAVTSVAFSSDGSLVLSGSEDRTIKLWDVSTGKEIRTFGGYQGGLAKLSWQTPLLPEMRHYSYGTSDSGWQKKSRDIAASSNHITCAVFSPDGKTVLVAGGDFIHLWDIASGRRVWTRVSYGSFQGFPTQFLAFAPDGSHILLGTRYPQIWEIDSTGPKLKGSRMSRPEQNTGDISPIVGEIRPGASGYDYVRLKDPGTGQVVSRNEIPMPSSGYSTVTSVTISPNGKLALKTGQDREKPSDESIVSILDGTTGKEVGQLKGHTAAVTGVAFSPDSKLVATGSLDGTVKLWEIAAGKESATLKGHTDWVSSVAYSPNGEMVLSGSYDGTARLWHSPTGNEICRMINFTNGEWIMLTPEGFFSASARGAQHLSFQSGNRIYSHSQFYDVFYRPDLVERKLKGEDISKYTGGVSIEQALRNPPPKVTILSPTAGVGLSERKATVKVKIEDAGGGIGDIRVYHNGKLVDSLGVYRLAGIEGREQPLKLAKADSWSGYRTAKGTILRRVQEFSPKKGSSTIAFTPATGIMERTYTILLIKGENTITVSAFNGLNTVTSPMESITVRASVPERKPVLYLLAIGNNTFLDLTYNLKMAVKDATDFTETVKSAAAPLYARVDAQLLTNARKEEILRTIITLSTRIQPEDVFVLYAATHGRAEDDLYYLYTSEFNGILGKPGTCISSVELMELSKRIPALKQVFVLDTCMAGGMESIVSGLYDARISVLAKSLGMHIFAGTKTYQEALDNYEGNGLFTHFVLAGLKGGADENKNKEVSVFEMDPYLTKLVKEASKGSQEPFIRTFGEDLPITQMRK